jgi:hypothetical protein
LQHNTKANRGRRAPLRTSPAIIPAINGAAAAVMERVVEGSVVSARKKKGKGRNGYFSRTCALDPMWTTHLACHASNNGKNISFS